ncbi:hypothetical protein [Microbulbifer sp. HZ11]|uniref:hypothetical protein n=1 Tax=Microbulbifer sp. HZ11 TaxID=1453501 RepID=UPI0012DF7B5A|nr:hypothetical protein [Microbulbifer sp. HZ11]
MPSSNTSARLSRRHACLGVLILNIVTVLVAGCSTPARQVVSEAYHSEKPRIDQWAADWHKDSDAEFRSDRSVLVATYATTEFTNVKRLRSTDELVSAKTPMVVAWLEMKKGPQAIPLYRYVVIPLKYVSAETLIQQGAYISEQKDLGLPAQMPASPYKGAVVTDWQYCYACFAQREIEELEMRDLNFLTSSVKRRMEARSLGGLYFLNTAAAARTRSAGTATLTVEVGERAREQQQAFTDYYLKNRAALADAREGDARYRRFWREEVEPLLFDAFAVSQGCPKDFQSSRQRYKRLAPMYVEQRIRLNREYVECRSDALARYDLNTYQSQYAQLQQRESALWAQSSGSLRRKMIPPQEVVPQAVKWIDEAAEGIESAYHDLANIEKAEARAAASKQRAEAFSQATWQSTFSAISNRNAQVLQQSRQISAMVDRAQSAPRPAFGKPNEERKSAESGSESEVGKKVQYRPDTASPALVAAAKEAEPMGAEENSENAYVGAGRDYPLSGSSSSYYQRSVAIDLAETNLRNQAAEFCGSSYKAEIRWSPDAECKRSAVAESFLCTRDALVNCYENRCEQEFCGTRSP